MRASLAALTVTLAGLAAASGASAQEWKAFTSEKFTVEFPGSPDVDVAGISTSDIAAVHNYGQVTATNAYRVTVFRLTGEADREQVLAFAVGILTNECAGVADTTVETAAGPVRDIVSTCRGQTYHARLVFGEGHLYEAVVTGPAGFETGADTLRFLDSFRALDTAPEWKPLTAEYDGFSIEVPGTPVIKERPFDTATFTSIPAFIVYHDAGLLRLTAIHFRPEVLSAATPEQVFGYARNTAPMRCATLFDGPLESTFGPGIEIAGRCPDGVDFRMQFILAGTSLYEIFASGPEGFIAGPDTARFIQSFKVVTP